MINIRRKLFIFAIALFIIGAGINLYYDSKAPNLNELKNIDTIQEKTEEEVLEEEEPEQETQALQDETEEEQQPSSDLPRIISGTIKSTLDFFFLKEINIVAIGDSLTQGVGDRTGEGGYIGILDRTINHDRNIAVFENYGKRGNRTNQLLKRLDEPNIIASIKQADIVLLTIGANDIMQVAKENFTNLTFKQFAEERVHFKERLTHIFSKIKEQNPYAQIYLLGIYNPFKQYFEDIKELEMIVNDWNNTSASVTAQFEDSTFIPIKDLFDHSEEPLFADDHFHPNYHGYYLIAERVLPYLTDYEGENNEEEETPNDSQ